MEFDRELFRLKAELQLNACHLSDVRDAIADLNREWDELQLIRRGIADQIIAIEKPYRLPDHEGEALPPS